MTINSFPIATTDASSFLSDAQAAQAGAEAAQAGAEAAMGAAIAAAEASDFDVVVGTHAALTATPTNGLVALVIADENYGDSSTVYVADGSAWIYSRRWLSPANNTNQPLRVLPSLLNSAKAGTVTQATVIPLFDSLLLEPMYHMIPWLSQELRCAKPVAPVTNNNATTQYSVAKASIDNTLSGGTNVTDYTQWHVGVVRDYPVSSVPVLLSGSVFYHERVVVACIVQSGGGTIQLRNASGTTGTAVDTSVGTPGDVVFVEYDAGAQTNSAVYLDITGAGVRVAYMWFDDTTVNRINMHNLLGTGGLSMNVAFAAAQARSNFAAVIAKICDDGRKPLVTWAARDDLTTSYEPYFGGMCDALDAVNAEVIICTPLPIAGASNEASNLDAWKQGEWLKSFANSRRAAGRSYAVVDLFTPAIIGDDIDSAREWVTAADVDVGDFNDGGVHQSATGTRSLYKPMIDYLRGYGGGVSIPWTTVSTRLGLGTTIGTPYSVWSDLGVTFSRSSYDNYSMAALFGGRSLRIQGPGGNDYFQVRGQNYGDGSAAYGRNVIPANVDFGSALGAKRLATSATYGGLGVADLTDTGNASGGLFMRSAGIVPYKFTKAQLATETAKMTVPSYVVGTQVVVSDASNGWPIWVATKVSNTVVWVDSRDGTTVLS